MYENDFYKFNEMSGIELKVPGKTKAMRFEKDHVTLVSKGEVVEEHSRTIPILIEISNRNGVLKIGQVLQAEIYTTEGEDAIVIPKSAVLDEVAQQFVFVQHEGEVFEKRQIKVGRTGVANV